MRKIILIQIFLLGVLKAVGQTSNIDSLVTTLQLNSSPAFVVLGIEPENIQRPNSPSEFVANVQSAVINGRMQPNFAIETSPYYWGKTRNKNYDAIDYIFNNNYGENLLRSLTFSFATSTSDTTTFGNLKEGTGIGIGMHLQLVQGKPSKKTIENLYKWYKSIHAQMILEQMINGLNLDQEIDDFDGWIDKILNIGSFKGMSTLEKTALKVFLSSKLKKKSFSKTDVSNLVKIKDAIQESAESSISTVNEYKFPLTREGFMLEFSIANASVAQESRWNEINAAKTSIWLTPSYRFNINKSSSYANFFDIMAVVRMTFNSSKVDSSHYFDFGGKLQWIHNRLSLSGETVYRILTTKPETVKKNYTLRTAVSLSYKINDYITFQSTFGSNFDGNSTTFEEPSKIFAVGGFNFGFGSFMKNRTVNNE